MTTRALNLVLPLAAFAGAALAADHKEAPLITEDAAADINDVYAFVSPTDPSKAVLVMTVNPFTVPAQNTNFRFSPNVRYRFEIDLNNDGRSDRSVLVGISDDRRSFTVDMPGNANDLSGAITPATLAATPNAPIIAQNGGGVRAFLGQRDDPFFFDFVGFNRFLGGTGGFDGTDAFAGFNVSAIVIEAPVVAFTGGATSFQTWGATDRRQVTLRRSSRGQLERSLGPWEQVERMGNPAVSTALIPSAQKDIFNLGSPEDDAADFAGSIVASLQSLGTNDENIGILASVALPDTLKLDTTAPAGFPNGRGLADDVIDTLFFFIFNQTPVSDGVQANDVEFLNEFPYMAAPRQPG